MTKKIQEKEDNYRPFLRMLQVTYPGYKFSFIPAVVGGMGTKPLDIKLN